MNQEHYNKELFQVKRNKEKLDHKNQKSKNIKFIFLDYYKNIKMLEKN